MFEQGKKLLVSIVLISILSISLYSNMIEKSKIGFNQKLDLIVRYIDNNFTFSDENKKKDFLKNQSLWQTVSMNDCSLIYGDIGSRSSFNIYFKTCIKEARRKRFIFLLDNYICKNSLMTGEKCLEKEMFFKILNKNQIQEKIKQP